MENERNQKQIYVTVVTSGLTMLANKVARVIQPNEDIFDACSELANEIAKENGLSWSNVLVQYFNHYSDNIPAMALKAPAKPKEKSTQELALEWWNSLISDGLRAGYTQKHLNSGIKYKSLTDKEIEEIWKNELCLKAYGTDLKSTKQEDVDFIINPENHNVNHKPNQKQFKQFNPELFKAYIDKFSDEDKIKALDILYMEIPSTLRRKWNT